MDLDLIWAVKYGGAWEDSNSGREASVNFVSVLNLNVGKEQIIGEETSVTLTKSPTETEGDYLIEEINSLVESKALVNE